VRARQPRHVRVHQQREAEVGHFDDLAAREQHVFRLDVAMDDALVVRVLESGEYGADDLERFGRRQRSLAHELAQARAVDVLHDEVGARVDFAALEHGHDVRMRQPAQRIRLAVEALEKLRIFGQLLGQDLERHGAAKAELGRAIDGSHAATAENLVDAVAIERPADQRIGFRFAYASACVGIHTPLPYLAYAMSRIASITAPKPTKATTVKIAQPTNA